MPFRSGEPFGTIAPRSRRSDNTTGLLLDRLSVAPIAAFSAFRKLRASQTYLFQLRRDDNAALTDIGATSDHEVDEAAIVTASSSTVGRIANWYDQTGNGWTLTHPTPSARPDIFSGGTTTAGIRRLNNKPAHRCAGSHAVYRNDCFGLSGDKSLTIISAFKQSTNNSMPWSIGTSANNRAAYLIQDNTVGAGISFAYYNVGLRFTLLTAIGNASYYTAVHTTGGNTHTGTLRQNGTALAQHSTVGAAGVFNLANTSAVWGAGALPTGGFLSDVTGNFWVIFDQILSAADLALCEAEAARHVA